jgi:hypothetical protein
MIISYGLKTAIVYRSCGIYPSNFKMQNSAGDKSALGKAAAGSFSGSKATTVNVA